MALRHPSPPQAGSCKAGISHAARAFSLSPCRRGPCKQFEAHGLTAFGLFPHKFFQEQAPDGISPGFRRTDGAPTSLPACGGALQSTKKEISVQASLTLISFRALRRERSVNLSSYMLKSQCFYFSKLVIGNDLGTKFNT